MQCTGTHCTTLHHAAPHCHTQHHATPRCTTLQRTATHCIILCVALTTPAMCYYECLLTLPCSLFLHSSFFSPTSLSLSLAHSLSRYLAISLFLDLSLSRSFACAHFLPRSLFFSLPPPQPPLSHTRTYTSVHVPTCQRTHCSCG